MPLIQEKYCFKCGVKYHVWPLRLQAEPRLEKMCEHCVMFSGGE